MDYRNQIKEYLEAEMNVIHKLDIDTINEVINEIMGTYEKEGNIYIFGNGGSSATASHFANDFNKGLSEGQKKKFRFCCLNDNMPIVMAIANDCGFDKVFVMQLEEKVQKNDLVIGISGSGNSYNVIRALEYAKEQNVKTIGITGYDGGKVSKIVNISLNVPVKNMQLTEDIHMIFDHLIMTVIYQTLNKNQDKNLFI